MIIASLQRTRLFTITENPDKADAVLRGSAEDLIYSDVFQSGESVGARANLSVGRGSSTRNRDYASVGGGVNESESSRIQERRHEASAAVRVVNKEGDVIWSTTQESQGAKFRSASADVADKVARQLVEDMDRLRARKSAGRGRCNPATRRAIALTEAKAGPYADAGGAMLCFLAYGEAKRREIAGADWHRAGPSGATVARRTASEVPHQPGPDRGVDEDLPPPSRGD